MLNVSPSPYCMQSHLKFENKRATLVITPVYTYNWSIEEFLRGERVRCSIPWQSATVFITEESLALVQTIP